jgi:uncharacterized protein
MEPAEAVFALLVLGVAVSLLVLLTERRPIEAARGDVLAIVTAALPGVALGLVILSLLDKPVLQVAVGLAVIAAAALQLTAERRPGQGSPAPGWTAYPAGFAAGVLTTSTSLSGPPLVLWLMRRNATPAAMRDTLAASFLALNGLGAASLAGLGGLPAAPSAGPLLVLLPATVIGQILGRGAFRRLDPRPFRAAALGLVVAAGAASVVAGTRGL